MSRHRKQLGLSIGVISLLFILLIYALIAEAQSLLFVTVVTTLLHVAVCGSLIYFLYYNRSK